MKSQTTAGILIWDFIEHIDKLGGNLYSEHVFFLISEHELTFNSYTMFLQSVFEKCYLSFARFIPSTLYIFITLWQTFLNIIFSLLL